MCRVIVASLLLLAVSSCTRRGAELQPVGQTSWESTAVFKELSGVVKGDKSYQQLSPEAQRLYIQKQAQIIIAQKMLESEIFTSDQVMHYLEMSSANDIAASVSKDPGLSDATKHDAIALINRVSEAATLKVPGSVRAMWVFMQSGDGNEVDPCETYADAISREEFIRRFEEFREEARQRKVGLIVTAISQSGNWIDSEIEFRGKRVRANRPYMCNGTTKFGSEIALD